MDGPPAKKCRIPRIDYKRYLSDCTVTVPRTTSWRKRKKVNLSNTHHTVKHSSDDPTVNNSTLQMRNETVEMCTAQSGMEFPSPDQEGLLPACELYDECNTTDEEQPNNEENNQQCVSSSSSLIDTTSFSVPPIDMQPLSELCFSQALTTVFPEQQTHNAMSPTDFMLMLVKLRHNLTKEATEDIGKLLNIVCGENVASTSMHNLQKNFCSGKQNVQVHHVCKNCGSYIGVVSSNEVCCTLYECSCKVLLQDSLKGGHFFFYLPLREQLIDLFENHKLYDCLHKFNSHATGNGSFCDIVDGNLYQSQLSKSESDLKLSLTFNCDGVPVFKSSSFSIWPIFCVVNELPSSVRGNHILMSALWFGSGKPNMNVYFEPFVEECYSLATDGFIWVSPDTKSSISCTASVVVGVCDAVARPLLQNFTQFNGRYGCGFCFDAGETIEKGNGRVNVYCFNEDMMLRTRESVQALVLESVEKKHPCMGVKGPSLLQMLPHFDIVRSMVPDYMHCICLGVARQMARLWFDSKNHDEPFYLGKAVGIIDKRLLAIKPPCSLSRTPRSVSMLKFWKAHEWLVWILYYSLPVLYDILPSRYYYHWAMMIDCVAILLKVEISLAELVYCERCFEKFVIDFEQLYGKKNVTFNVHQTLHLVQSVKDWGPLWSHSAFLFESFNGVLLKMIRGTQGVPMQILQTFCLNRAIPCNIVAILPRCSPKEQQFIESLSTRRRKTKAAVASTNEVTVLGRPIYRRLHRSHYVALHSVSTVVRETVVAYYNRAVIRGLMVHSYDYCKNLKRNSYTVELVDGSYYQVITFLIIDLGNGDNCYAIGRYTRPVPFQFISCKDMSLKLSHLTPVAKVSSALVAVPASDIIRKCVFVSVDYGTTNFICDQVHLYEYCL